MNEKMKALKRMSLVLFLVVVAIAVVKTNGQEETKASDRGGSDQWEYLVVGGPSSTNLTPTGNSRMRKEPAAPFAREAFVFEQHLDKLGTNGWELVTISGPVNDPSFYFKRRK